MFIAPILADAGGSLLDSIRQTGEQFGSTWPLFLSNCVSFLIVAWLLNRFAYRPILDVLEERRQRIAASLENAEKIKRQLADAEAQRTRILQDADADAQKMIDEARTAAQAQAQTREQAAIAEAEGIIAQAREAIALERDRMLGELRREVARLVVDTTGKVTGKILTVEDQRRLSEEAAREIAA
ncbi:MAG: F0F1 ATP synthase subunit B [Chthoniobacteraceae bacterium]|nr:F0F1 ATP synthase subunit B [Chthoniobacteraceae bacterium]